MLKNNFYTIEKWVNDNEDRFSCCIKFNCEHKIFAAHFPNQPIVPGACILEICKELLSEFYHKELIINRVSTIKFLNTINPMEFKEVNCLFEVKKLATTKMSISIESGETKFAKISLPFENN